MQWERPAIAVCEGFPTGRYDIICAWSQSRQRQGSAKTKTQCLYTLLLLPSANHT